MIKLTKSFWLLISGLAVILVVGGGYILYRSSTTTTPAKTEATNSNYEWEKSQFKVKTIADVKKAAKTNNVLVLFTNDPNKKEISSETKQIILDLEKKYPHHIPTVITAGYVRPTDFGLTVKNRDNTLYPTEIQKAQQGGDRYGDVAIGLDKGWNGETEDQATNGQVQTETGTWINNDNKSDLAERYFSKGLDAQMYWYKEDSKY